MMCIICGDKSSYNNFMSENRVQLIIGCGLSLEKYRKFITGFQAIITYIASLILDVNSCDFVCLRYAISFTIFHNIPLLCCDGSICLLKYCFWLVL